MNDRVPLYPGRVKLVPVSGQENVYDMIRADEPTQEGTPMSKATFLKDETAAMFGLGVDAVPDDVFCESLDMTLSLAGKYAFIIKTMFSDGTIVPNIKLEGVTDKRGNAAVTDNNGMAMAFSDSNTATVTISNYIGIEDCTQQIQAGNDPVTPVDVILSIDTGIRLIEQSGTYSVLKGRKYDLCAVGGGAGGIQKNGGDGGGGGYAQNYYNIELNDDITVEVGAGGQYTTVESPGGKTTVLYNGEIIAEANGAEGKTGNGDGGNGDDTGTNGNGTDGSIHVFDDDSLPLPGGGGGGGVNYDVSQRTGGLDFGAVGGKGYGSSQARAAGQPKGPGGGGGGCGNTNSSWKKPASSGHAGGLYIRLSNEVSA